jgi:hypothetical protein
MQDKRKSILGSNVDAHALLPWRKGVGVLKEI